MWWSVLALSFTIGAVFASEVTLPLSVNFGDGLVTFSEKTDGLSYTIKSQGNSRTRPFSLAFHNSHCTNLTHDISP